MDKEEMTIEEVIKEQAKRLDKIVAKKKYSNGIITPANFSIVGERVTLQGAELVKIGTGYAAEGETVAEKIVSIVDAVEEDLVKVEDGESATELEVPEEEVEENASIYDNYTKKELKKECEAREIEISGRAKNQEMIDALVADDQK